MMAIYAPSFREADFFFGGSAAAAAARMASSDDFCSSIVLMLICMKFWLIASQFSITRSSAIFLSISAGLRVASIAAGLGNGMPAGASPAADPAGGANPGTGMPNGFHMRCMNAIASCGVKGIVGCFVMDEFLRSVATIGRDFQYYASHV
ncbi:MAG: hypothetical protein ACREYB_11625 [Casimicrobiaceae bacterium]